MASFNAPAKPKSHIKPLLAAIMALLAGWATYFFMHPHDTPVKAAQRLATQNLTITEENFFAEIKAARMNNIHDFLMAGGAPGTVDLQGNGISALMVAAQTGNKDVLALMLSAVPAAPEEAAKTLELKDTAEGKTVLMMAVEKDAPDIVALLLAHGADTLATDKTGATPLILAVLHPSPDLLQPLIAADMKQHQGLSLAQSDTHGETPLTQAIRRHDAQIVKTLLAAKADAALADRGGSVPLMIAAEIGDKDIAAQLIAAGAKPDIADIHGNTPLSIAIHKAHPDFVNFLLEKGADPDFHTSGPLPLQVAIGEEHFDAPLFTTLLKRSKQTGKLDASLLFDAIHHKNADLAQALLDHGIDAKARDAEGRTLLYNAIESGLEDLAIALIDKGADMTQTGVTGIIPLETAVKRNLPKVVKRILDTDVSPNQKTTEGYTLAEMAVYSGTPETLDMLLAKGAKLQKDFGVLWAIRDGGGKSVPVLLKYGASANIMSNSGEPALWLAASAGENEAVAGLIKAHATLDYPNSSQGMTPLAIASHNGQLAAVEMLVEAGAKMEVADAFGMTPLAHAAYMAKPDVVEYLLGMGANANAADKEGRGVADLAAMGQASSERDRVFSLLRTTGKKVGK